MKSWSPVFLLVAVLASDARVAAASAQAWPAVQPSEVVIGMNWQAEKLYLDLPLFDTYGKIRYRLVCRGGSERHLDELDSKLHINYVGPMMCILNAGDHETEASLLREESIPPWFTRGQFAYKDIIGNCGSYPEYGRVRHFRLRGFELTLEIIDPEIDNGKVDYLVFKISVRNDPTATSAIAEPVHYPDPRKLGGDCGGDW